MKNIFLLSFLFAFFFFSCNKDDDEVANAVACFTVDAAETTDSTHTFLFNQCPPAYDVSYWDFDDGTYSSNPNPSHVFNLYGTYNVKLTVTNSVGHSSSTTKTITIGHYSLDKIVYNRTWTYYSPPITLSLNSTQFFSYDTLTSFVSLPISHQLTDSSIYDMANFGTVYNYVEIDSASNFQQQAILIIPSQISNNKYDVVFPTASNDTAKFTLHFKLAPR